MSYKKHNSDNLSNVNRLRDADTNPCLKEGDLSLACLESYHNDSTACKKYFVNYNNCKMFWNAVKQKRYKAGITPTLPTQKERSKIMEARRNGMIIFEARVDDDE